MHIKCGICWVSNELLDKYSRGVQKRKMTPEFGEVKMEEA